MQLAVFTISPIRSNCYVLSQDFDEGRDAVIVDPGDTALDPVFAYIEQNHLNILEVWNTHAHFDHVMGVDVVRERYQAPAYVNEADLPIWQGVAEETERMFGRRISPLAKPDGNLEDGRQLWIGAETFTVIHSPGHSPGSVCLVGQSFAFTGDTLFAGTIGATHFHLGDPAAMERSLRRLLELPDDLVLYPGHGKPTTMGIERKNNPYLRFE